MIRRAIAFSLAQRYGELAIQIGSMIVLARLIPPDEFGVFVAGAAVLALTQVLGEFGLGDFIIREKVLTTNQRAAALGLSLTVSATCVLMVVGALLFLPNTMVDQRFRTVLGVLTLVMLVRPFVVAVTALMQRDMRFGPVCTAGLARTSALAAVSIVLAWQGLGALGLAWATVVAEVVALGVVIMAAGTGPAAPSVCGWGRAIRFGAMRSAVAGLSHGGDAGTVLITSQLLGFAAAGLLSRGQRITKLFDETVMQAVRPVVLPALARRRRSDNDLTHLYFLKTACISGLAWPFFGFMAMFAEPVVAVLLGSSWGGVVPIVLILCLRGMCTPLTRLNAEFFVALDLLPAFLRRQMILQPIVLLLVAAAALVSAEWVAAALVAERLLKAAINLGPLRQQLGFTFHALAGHLRTSLFVTAASLVPAVTFLGFAGSPQSNDVAVLLGSALISVLGWIVGVSVSSHPLGIELSRLLRSVWGRFRGSGASVDALGVHQ